MLLCSHKIKEWTTLPTVTLIPQWPTTNLSCMLHYTNTLAIGYGD
jgi:hypothetical protein